jgi:ureidoglycolate lyase
MSEPLHLIAKALTTEAFAPYGEVFAAPRSEGRENTDWDLPGFDRAKLCLSLSRRGPTTLPFSTQIMERHRQSQQIFIPLRVSRFLIIVAPNDGAPMPKPERAIAFIGQPGQALNYRVDTWHHPFTVLDQEAEYASLMFRDGGPLDEEFVDLPRPVLITA